MNQSALQRDRDWLRAARPLQREADAGSLRPVESCCGAFGRPAFCRTVVHCQDPVTGEEPRAVGRGPGNRARDREAPAMGLDLEPDAAGRSVQLGLEPAVSVTDQKGGPGIVERLDDAFGGAEVEIAFVERVDRVSPKERQRLLEDPGLGVGRGAGSGCRLRAYDPGPAGQCGSSDECEDSQCTRAEARWSETADPLTEAGSKRGHLGTDLRVRHFVRRWRSAATRGKLRANLTVQRSDTHGPLGAGLSWLP